MNGDGKLDILALSSDKGISLFEQIDSESTPQFVDRGVIIPEVLYYAGAGMDVADVDGDGNMDIVIGSSRFQIILFRRIN